MRNVNTAKAAGVGIEQVCFILTMRNVNDVVEVEEQEQYFSFILTMRNVNIIVPIIPIPIGNVLY